MDDAPNELPGGFPLDLGKLDVSDGDVVVIRLTDEMMEAGNAIGTAFRDMLAAQGFSNCVVVLLRPGVELGAFDEDEMRKLGWVRAESNSAT